jgi:GNAT superfamily N-acetyltransferase
MFLLSGGIAMSKRLIIDTNYCERLTLSAGETVCLRLIRPSDKATLLRAFTELSSPSRYKRFFSAKHTLNEEELRYFTETDGWDHFALAAVTLNEKGQEGDGLGIARCIRFADDPECAEVAVTVIDRMQGKGVGRALLERLITAAIERGIKRLRFECLAHNQEMQHLVRNVCHVVESQSDGEVVTVETQLPEQIPESAAAPLSQQPLFNLYTVFRAIAIQTIDLQMSLNRNAMKRALKYPFSSTDLLRQIKRPLPTKPH